MTNFNGGVPTQNEQTITSLEIAEITGKNHKELMRSIRNQEVAWEKVRGRKFALSSQKVKMPNGGFRKQPFYFLSQKESLYISSKFDDEIRAKLVMRWYELETTKAIPEAQINKIVTLTNHKGELPVVDLPMEVELVNRYPVRSYMVNGVKLTLVTDLVRAHKSGARAYKQARKANKGAMKAIKLIDCNGMVVWAVDALGRQILTAQLKYQQLLASSQLKLAL